MHGAERVAAAFAEALGIDVGQTTPDGRITLEHTSCIGMCDQSPAALINDVVVTNLSTDGAELGLAGVLQKPVDPQVLLTLLKTKLAD
jgi:[NiFe] hydrogenase diaphorase moiety large subunit